MLDGYASTRLGGATLLEYKTKGHHGTDNDSSNFNIGAYLSL
ncbi:MAG TPA: hypothetical protein VIU34_10180 [Steroidobacter sp.]